MNTNPNANQYVQAIAVTKGSSAAFQINSTSINVLVVILSINGNIKFLENINQGIKRTVSWNKYRSEITTQPKKSTIYII